MDSQGETDKSYRTPGLRAHIIIPERRRLMQEDCCGFKANLNYIAQAQSVLCYKILFGEKKEKERNALGVKYPALCCNPVPILKRS